MDRSSRMHHQRHREHNIISSTTTARGSRLSSSARNNVHRAPQDNGCEQSQSRDRRRYSKRTSATSNSEVSRTRNGSKSSTPTHHEQQPTSSSNFAKIAITAVIFIAIADLILLWTSIDATIGNYETTGPEAGMHTLHEKVRTNDIHLQQLVSDLVKKQLQARQQQLRATRQQQSLQKRMYAPIEKVKNMAKVEKVKNTETFGVDDHIVKILTAANIQLDEELPKQLPSWDDIVSMYGEHPIIHGLDTCQTYRDTVKPEDRMLGPAGIFNTGTNLLFELMKANCNIIEARTSTTHREPKRNGMRFQPPWGKHNPPNYRKQHVAKFWGDGINQTAFFPVVMIKDFYSWAGSQCRHSYTSWWDHDAQHCPKLVNAHDRPNRVAVRYGKSTQQYTSLLDLWNKYYQEWEDQTFPHLTTRYEDLLFHGEEVTRTACDCIGGVFTSNFGYVEGSAKENGLPIHNGANGLVKSLLQYGDPSKRLIGFTANDRLYTSRTIDSDLVRKYGYSAPPLPT